MKPIVELRGVTKRFGSVEVLSDIDLALFAGRVHSLAGENGAGKSTIVKILAGVHEPDSGRVLVDGVETRIFSPAEAQRQRIAVVQQHPTLFPDLSVAENVFVGRQPLKNGRIDWDLMRIRAEELLTGLRMDIDVRTAVKALTIAERQAVEIIKALSIDARVLVLDEPTSAISGRELDRLLDTVRQLQQKGVAILFISHFLEEILQWGDDVTILRSGKRITSGLTADLTPATTARYMIGAEPSTFFPKEKSQIGGAVLSVRGLCGAVFVNDVSFEVRAGEILGFFGLIGAGRSEVAQMLFGITKPDSGEIRVDGAPVRPGSPKEAMSLGISFVPEDRHQQGLVLQFAIRANETLPILQKLSRWFGIVRHADEARIARDFTNRVRVISTGVEQRTDTLSGGNQQKVLLAKWLIPQPKILILDQPTRGIDVGAKAEIHRIVSDLAKEGVAIVLIGDDAEEVIAMADRILVFRAGKITAEAVRASFDRETILLAAAHTMRGGVAGAPGSL